MACPHGNTFLCSLCFGQVLAMGPILPKKPKPILEPEQILTIAEDSYLPAKRFVLFSGGNDSATLVYWLLHNTPIQIDGAVHINTGIGVQQTREFVRDFCRDFGVPLIEKKAPEGEYERLCREYGVPGPGAHWQAYRYLKDRQIEALVREHRPPKEKAEKGKRSKPQPPIMLITGVRKSESKRRMGTTRPIKERKGQLWVAPHLDWSKQQFTDYRNTHDIPRNEVADVLHMSGECLCGAFGGRDELHELAIFYPEVYAQIQRAEEIARTAGQKYCQWGRARNKKDFDRDDMDMCSNCMLKLFEENVA